MRLTVFLLTFCAITPAFALHCKNDYAGSAGCAANSTPAGDCTTLGFSKSDVAGCDQYLYCMFDTSYKRCISKSDTTCPVGYGKTVNDCGAVYAAGWTLGTLNSSGCGKCIKKSCPSGTATTAAGCASGVITSEFAMASSGDDFCYNCQPVSTTCSDGYATSVSGCPDNRLYVLDTSQKDSAGCYKCVKNTCSYHGLEPMNSPLVNDGYHLCKEVHEYGLYCQDCVSCTEYTYTSTSEWWGVNRRVVASWNSELYAIHNEVCEITGASALTPLILRGKKPTKGTETPGVWKDDQGRTASFCYVLSSSNFSEGNREYWEEHGYEILGCCKDGQITWDKIMSDETMGDVFIEVNATNCPHSSN